MEVYTQISEQPKNIFLWTRDANHLCGWINVWLSLILSNAPNERRTRSQQLELISDSWRGTGHLWLGCSSVLVFPGLKGFLDTWDEKNVETGVLLNKPECLVTLRHNYKRDDRLSETRESQGGIQGEILLETLWKCPWKRLTCEHFDNHECRLMSSVDFSLGMCS